MRFNFPGIALTIAALSLAACGGGGGGGIAAPPAGGGGVVVPPGVGPLTIGLALPTGTIGVENDPVFGIVGGFTQQVYSQVMAFSPGTAITIKNLSSTTPHTLNGIGTVSGTPSFPAAPSLTTGPAGTAGKLDASYASGTIAPNATVGPVTLSAGTYYLGCAFHYSSNQMRSALVVAAAATPGPQATPQPSGPGGGGPGCVGGYC